ncbi:MAG: Fe-S cluster assembly protein SufD [Marinifilaceae bacterium]
MKEIHEINKDLLELYAQGASLLNEGCSAIMNNARRDAIEQFDVLGGVPHRTEDYKYLNLLPAYGRDYKIVLKRNEHELDVEEVFRCSVTNLESYPVLTTNGRYYHKNIEIDEDIIVCGLQEASVKHADIFVKYYGKGVQLGAKDPLLALNTAFAQDGVFIYVPDNVIVEKPLQVINLLRSVGDMMSYQRNLVVLGRNAKLHLLMCDHTLTHSHFLMNTVTEVWLEANAQLDFNEVQNQHLGTSLINSICVNQSKDSRWESNFVTLYGGIVRNNVFIALNEPNAECSLYGINIADKQQKVDNFLYVDHKAPHCRSNQHFKGVLDDSAIANFTGVVRVHRDAQQTESFQANNNLLLKDTARVNAKPQLIIDADDVKCSHGATVGQIDDEAMYYLRSRGIGVAEAKMMLMFGFAHDIIGRVKLEPLREKIDDLVDKRLRGELSKCHNCVISCAQGK